MSINIKGYCYGIIAAASYGMNPLFALPLYSDGMSPTSVLFFRYVLALPILAFMMFVRKQPFAIPVKNLLWPLVALGLLMGFSSYGLFLSYRYMPAGIASTILFVYPLMVAVLMATLFHQKISKLTCLCLVIATAGIGLLSVNGDWGDSGKYNYFLGITLVLLSSLAYAIYIVCVNTKKIKPVPTLTLTFYVLLFGALIFIIPILCGASLQIPSSPAMWTNVFCLALVPTAISLIFTTLAIQSIGSTPTAILGVFEPVTAIFFGVTIFGETLVNTDICGIILIMSAVTLVIMGDRTHVPLNRIKKLFPSNRKKHG